MLSNPTLARQLKTLPQTPGIYHFFDEANKLLYVGKAANLKRRVTSYWHRPQDWRISELVRRIDKIKVTPTDSIIEALILEANTINAAQPPYNIRQKDDKTFVMIAVTDELFPGVIVIRPTQKLRVPLRRQFGPYPSADQARLAIKIIRKILPFRTTCKIPLGPFHSPSGKLEKGCFDSQIGLCPGICAGVISSKNYARQLRKVVLFLEGRKTKLVKQLQREMTSAAKQQDFEKASQLRNQLFALQHIQDVSLLRAERSDIPSRPNRDMTPKWQRVEGYDISNTGSQAAVGSMVVLTDGQTNQAEYRKFQIRSVAGQNDLAMMHEVLTRRFRHREWPLPDLIIIDGGKEHLKIGRRVIRQARLNIPIIAVAKGPHRDRLDIYPSFSELIAESSELKVLVRIARDEAHRFAIRYHRYRRDKDFLVE